MSFLEYMAEQRPEEQRMHLFSDLEYFKEAEIYETLLHIDDDLIQPLMRQGKTKTPVYKLLERVRKMLFFAGEANAKIERMKNDMLAQRAWCEHLTNENARLTRMLSRFEVIEDLEEKGMLESYIIRVRQVIKEKREYELKKAVK